MCSERRKLSKKVLGAIVFAVVVVIVVIVVVVLAVRDTVHTPAPCLASCTQKSDSHTSLYAYCTMTMPITMAR